MIGVLEAIIPFICSLICFYIVSVKLSPLDDYRTRIVKGFQCSPLDYPFLVSLAISKNSHFCGGSLLSKNLVLTAAHCCEDEKYFTVWAGLTRVKSVVQNAYVSEAYIHPNYTREPLSTDLCVLKLASDIMENEYIRYTSIINTNTWDEWLSIDNCKTAVAMGFGYQGIKWENGTPKNPHAAYTPMMQCVKLSILQPNICRLGLDNTMFCAIDPLFEGRDPCQGDSGGPLVCKGLQVGIISAGFGCGLEGYASIYTRVDLFYNYLSNIITRNGSVSISAALYMLLSCNMIFILSS